jgi:4-hydroxythreonine-4-phosphate dehydrogenase
VLFGDREDFAAGARVAALPNTLEPVSEEAAADAHAFACLVEVPLAESACIHAGEASLSAGLFAQKNFQAALNFARSGRASAVVYMPLNKRSMRLADGSYDDDIDFINKCLGVGQPASEFNILDNLWNARVTSHIPLSAVAGRISVENIVAAAELTERTMRAAGHERPRIAVAGLNPHAGDGGNYGSEEIDIIAPAVAAAASRELDITGPYPADTVFLMARSGRFDAVLTMFHDQGQIAMKLMGFDRGVTLIAGYDFPICTPAHGTAFDIVGKGTANTGSVENAVLLAARLSGPHISTNGHTGSLIQ